MTYLATFFTHSGAIKYEKFLKENAIEIVLMPVPRKISSSCGVAAKFDYKANIETIISSDIHQMYEVQDNDYQIIYDAE